MNSWKIGGAKSSASGKMANAVLDSSAVLAVLNAEPGADLVTAVLDDAVISTVNYAEVVTKLVERGSTDAQARAALRAIALTTVDFDFELAHRTGLLRSNTLRRGLSLGDRACLALAEREGVPAFTADRSWVGALPDVEVRVIR
jgi:ribonuclease VapC